MKVKFAHITSLFLIILVLFGAYYVIAGINNVTLDSPTGAANYSNASGSTATFQCTAVPNATEYVGNISLGFNFTDAGAPNASIVLNISQNLSNGTNTSVFIFNTGTLREGRYLWSCLAANTTGNGVVANRSFDKIQADNNGTTNGSAKASGSNGTILIDGTAPSNITLISPGSPASAAGGANLSDADFTNGSVTVVWKVADTYMTNSVCNVTVNGVVRSPTNVIGVSNNSANFSATVAGFTNLVANTWSVSCTDYLGNANTTGSGSRTINITDATVPTINGIDQKLRFFGTLNGERDVEATKFDYGTPVNIKGCNGTDNVDYFNTNATIYIRRPGASVFAIERNDTSGISNFEFTDTEALGFYEVNCTIRDNAGNQNSTAKTFEILRSVRKTNFFATTDGFRQPISTGSRRDFGELATDSVKTRVSEGGAFLFQIDGETHEVLVDEIKGDVITVVVKSDPITATIKSGESKSFDVDNDGTNDIEVKLEAITSSNRADITFTRVSTPAPKQDTTEPTQPTRPSTPIFTKEEAGSLLKILVVVFVILLIVYFFIRIKKRPSNKLQFSKRDLGAYRDTTLQLYYK